MKFYVEELTIKLLARDYLELLNDVCCESRINFDGCTISDIMFTLGVIFNRIKIKGYEHVILEVPAVETIRWLFEHDYFSHIPAKITLKNIKYHYTENVVRMKMSREKI